MPEKKFEPTPAEQFGDEGLRNIHDETGEDRDTKGPLDEKIQRGVLAGQRDKSGKLRRGIDYPEGDKIDIENIPVTDTEGNEFGEGQMIELIAAREEVARKKAELKERKRILDSGKAVLISKPEDSLKKPSEEDRGTRQFATVGEQMAFIEKRERAKEKARQRYEAEQQKQEEQNNKKERKDA